MLKDHFIISGTTLIAALPETSITGGLGGSSCDISPGKKPPRTRIKIQLKILFIFAYSLI
jgi:hypothetical protein